VLSGGSTMFDGFTERLQKQLQNTVDQRLKLYSVGKTVPKPIQVKVA